MSARPSNPRWDQSAHLSSPPPLVLLFRRRSNLYLAIWFDIYVCMYIYKVRDAAADLKLLNDQSCQEAEHTSSSKLWVRDAIMN